MYTELIQDKLDSLKESGQYREFVTINRINVTPNHTEEQIIQLTSALVEVFHYFDIPFAHAKELVYV